MPTILASSPAPRFTPHVRRLVNVRARVELTKRFTVLRSLPDGELAYERIIWTSGVNWQRQPESRQPGWAVLRKSHEVVATRLEW